MLRRRHTLRFAAPLTLALLVALGAPAQAAPEPSPADPSPDVHTTPFSAPPEHAPRTAPPLPELQTPAAPEEAGYAPDHVLVRFATTASPSQQRSSLSALGTQVEDVVDGTGWVQVDVGDQDPTAVVAKLDADPQVADVQLDHVRHAFAVPNDPYVQSVPYFDLLRLPRAWDTSTGTGTVVAVLDTGVFGTHPELAGSVLAGTDLIGNDSDPEDVAGHGTLVAGVIAAHANNADGAAGAAYGAKILPVKVLDDTGSGTDSTVAAGITWATSHGADVINLSLGGPDPAPVVLTAIQSAVAAGVVVVAAAGNEGTDVPMYPAAYAPQVDGLLAVSATDDYGSLTDFSSWGDWVTLAAPGYQVVGPSASGWYTTGTGTSFAAPFVSGAAALVVAHSPALTPAAVEQRLVSTATDAGPRGIDPYYGRGVLDAAAAVTAADTYPAAPGVPLDRAPTDPGGSDDTRATARSLPGGGSTATLSPEGDVDWYRVDAPSAGWYVVQVDITPTPGVGVQLVADVEVRNAAGDIVASASTGGNPTAQAFVPVPAAGTFYVEISEADGAISTDTYTITAAPGTAPPFTRTHQSTPPDTYDGPIAVGDVTGDGRADAVSAPLQGSALDVYAGQAGGTVAAPTLVALPSGTFNGSGIAGVDVNGDGRMDVVAATTTGVQVFTQPLAGGLVAGTSLSFADAQKVVAADIDGDGDQDLVLTSWTAGGAQVAKNNGTGTFTLGAVVPSSIWIAVGDVTRDGRPDIVDVSQYFAQKPDGTFADPVALPSTGFGLWRTLAIADVTGDGFADVIRPSASNNGLVQVDSMQANQTFAASHSYPAYEIPDVIATGDVTGDGRTDVVVTNSGWLGITVLPQKSDGTLGAPITFGAGNYVSWYQPDGLKVGDVDGDGHNDLVLSDNGMSVFRQNSLDQAPLGHGWLKGVTPATNSAGAGVRPTVSVALERALKAGSASASTVRLINGATGAVVPASVTYTSGTKTIGLTPSADLSPGSHYEVIVAGLTDSANAVQDEPIRSFFTVAANGSRFTPIDPVRIFDSRDYGFPIESGEQLVLDLSGLAAAGGTAVVLNVTATGVARQGNVRVYPTPANGIPPTVSNLNVVPGVDQPNLVTVALGADGTISLLPEATSTHLIVDVSGYYSAGGAAAFEPLAPVRVMDLRDGTGGVPQGRLAAGAHVDLQVTGRNGVPADAVAVVLNVTGTQTAAPTHVRVYPTPGPGDAQGGPDVSNLNLRAGRDQPNLVTVKVGDGGRIRFDAPVAATYLLADLAGYYTATGDNGYVPLTPARIADTRFSQGFTGLMKAGKVQDLQVTGLAGVPADATAAVLNVTGSRPRDVTHIRVFPTTVPATLPDVSSLNLVPGRDEANLVIARLGVGGKVSFFTFTADTDLIVDVSGYFRK